MTGSKKRKYTRLAPSVWAEIRGLWELGDCGLAELAERYSVSARTLQIHFAKHKVVKGAKGAEFAAAVKEKLFDKKLPEIELTTIRARDIRDAGYRHAVTIENMIMAQIELARTDPSQILRVASGVKALALAAGGLERLYDLKCRALGLDKEAPVLDVPELVIRDLSKEEIVAIKSRDSEDDLESLEALPDHPVEGGDDEIIIEGEGVLSVEDEIIVEDPEVTSKATPVEDDRSGRDADGCRYVRGAG